MGLLDFFYNSPTRATKPRDYSGPVKKKARDVAATIGTKADHIIHPTHMNAGWGDALTQPFKSTPTLPKAPAGPSLNDLLPQLVAPSLSSYLAPYDQAQKATQERYDAALPQIVKNYSQLRDELSSQHAAAQQALSQQANLAVKERVQLQKDLAAQTAAPLADIAKQFGGEAPAAAVSGVNATNAQQQANLKSSAGRQDQLMKEMAAQYAADNKSRIADSTLAEVGAKQVAKQNLDSILGKIGVERAGAERQYVNDANANAIQQFTLQQKLAKENAITPRDALQAQSPQLEKQYPVAWGAFNDIVENAGGNYKDMLKWLATNKEDLANGKAYKKKLDVKTLRSWIDAYGDNKTKIPVG